MNMNEYFFTVLPVSIAFYHGQGLGGSGAYPRNTGHEPGICPGWDTMGNLSEPIHLAACLWNVPGN